MIEKRERRRRDGTSYAVWRVRWRDEAGSERSKSFDRVGDARAFEAKLRLLNGALLETTQAHGQGRFATMVLGVVRPHRDGDPA